MIDAPGQPFHDPEADAALFDDDRSATWCRPATARSSRVAANINDEAFVEAVLAALRRRHAHRERRSTVTR